jgi:hypothetical protein
MLVNKFKHSGAFGDLIYSLSIVKYLGGGEFYLHLNQIDWIGQHYYGSKPNPFHQGRLKESDFEFMKEFMLAQEYLSKFEIMNPASEITHNLDRFRTLFVGHPGNYVDIYSVTFGIKDPLIRTSLRNSPWLTVPEVKVVENRPVVINRTSRWIPSVLGKQWTKWQEENLEKKSVFVGLPEEYEQFKKTLKWDIPYQPVDNMLELAQYIAGAELFIGNQSVALSLAIGLGTKFYCELRQDLPLERNECWFKDHPNGSYF